MGSLTDQWEIKVMEHALGVTSLAPPTTLALALFTSNPQGEAGTPFNWSAEVSTSGTNYSRATSNMAPTSGNWTASTRAVTNVNAIIFPTPSASWGQVTYWAICNHATNTLSDTAIFWGQIAGAGVTIGASQIFQVQSGGIDVAIPTGFFSNYASYAILRHLFNNVTWTRPTGHYIGVSVAAFGDAGTSGIEPDDPSINDSSYARIAASFQASGTGTQYENDAAISFNQATVDWDDGAGRDEVIAVGVFDNASPTNNLLFHGSMNPVTIDNGNALQFGTGSLTLAVD